MNDKPSSENRGDASADTAPVTPSAGPVTGGPATPDPSSPATTGEASAETAGRQGWRAWLRTRSTRSRVGIVAVALAVFLGGGLVGYGVAQAASDDHHHPGPGHGHFERDGAAPPPPGGPRG